MWSMLDIKAKGGGTRYQRVHSQVGARLLKDGEPLVWITGRWPHGVKFEVFEIPRDCEGALASLKANGALDLRVSKTARAKRYEVAGRYGTRTVTIPEGE